MENYVDINCIFSGIFSFKYKKIFLGQKIRWIKKSLTAFYSECRLIIAEGKFSIGTCKGLQKEDFPKAPNNYKSNEKSFEKYSTC